MATKKDLVEAYSFSRRRLVTAFVSGAPGGREVEPARPGRTIVGGLALAVLLAAGAAIAGVFAPRTPTDWAQAGLVISKDTGAAYVVTGEDSDLELRPVINITSAKLILGPDVEPTLIPQDTIDEQRIGEDIGILGAPASLPAPDLLVESGWTSCTADGAGMRVRVAVSPSVAPADGRQVLVRSGGELFLVAQPAPDDTGRRGAYVYRVPEQRRGSNDQTDKMLLALGAGIAADAVRVPREWLNLFPRGGDLDWSSFALDGLGEPAPGAQDPDSNIPGGAKIGDVLSTASGESVLLTADGPTDLDPFSLAVYDNVETPTGFRDPLHVDALPNRGFAKPPFEDAHWPTETLEALGDTDPCAQLRTADGEAPIALLTQAPGSDAVAQGIAADAKEVAVDPGRGAYVLSGGWTDPGHGEPFAIDAKGRANPLVGDAAAQLGYADYPVPVVPDTWVALFGRGVDLSQDAALCPPTLPGDGESSCG